MANIQVEKERRRKRERERMLDTGRIHFDLKI